MGLRAKTVVSPRSKCNVKLTRASSSASPSTIAATASASVSASKCSSKCSVPMNCSRAKENKSVAPAESPAVGGANVATKMTCVTTTIRNSSTASLVSEGSTAASSCPSASAVAVAAAVAASLRPQTLNVQNLRETPTNQTQLFFGEVLNAWRAKARCNVVPVERTQELFHELSFHPSEKQIGEMIQTAKMLARKGSRQSNGLTFGEFCVLAADLKRFRASTFQVPSNISDKLNFLDSIESESYNLDDDNINLMTKDKSVGGTNACESKFTNAFSQNVLHQSTKHTRNAEDCSTNKKMISERTFSSDTTPVEVFLGGSCNPTTWRADVAIPALKESGISFYNPQVSDWTPDLIELEHRAKEKARVLFFVMDSETRASAGAIEAAHIAGQNCKQLVLVLHPYKPNQYILNEPISQQEYMDLTRNQMILKELVTRRGLPVLDNIPSALQRTKEILVGIRDPPSNIASILVVVRGAFDRVSQNRDVISIEQCQQALLYLGYAQSIVSFENLNKIIETQRESLEVLRKQALTNKSTETCSSIGSLSSSSIASDGHTDFSDISTPIDFELFCIISAYLSVLQQEIHESGCISPIKGTNVPPPPVFLANLQGDENFTLNYYSSTKNISRTSSNASVPGGCNEEHHHQCLSDLLSRSRDSGTSSPQLLELPLKSKSTSQLGKANKTQILVNIESIETTTEITTKTQTPTGRGGVPNNHPPGVQNMPSSNALNNASQVPLPSEEESDSNDSVFSSSSSINSINCSNYCDALPFSALDFRDVYLGGSCALRTNWRQDVAVPYLKSKSISFHLPSLHESILPSQLDISQGAYEETRNIATQERSFMRTRRKDPTQGHEEEVTIAEEKLLWSLPMSVRSNIYNPSLLDSSRVLLFVITNETRSLAPMTLAAHCIGLMYNVVLSVQMLPENCIIGNEKLTPAAIKDYNRGRSYLIDLAKRQGVPVFNDLKAALEHTVEKIKSCNSRGKYD